MTLFSAITSKIFGGIAIALLILLATTTIDRNQWRAAARKGDATIAKFSVVQEAAQKAAQDAHDAQEQRYKELANAADAKHADNAAAIQSGVDSWIAAHRVPAANAACPASRSASPASGSNPQGAVGPDPAAGMVAVSPESIHICTDNTLRLEATQDWATWLSQPALRSQQAPAP